MTPSMRPAAAISPLATPPAMTMTAIAFIGSRGIGSR